MTNEVKNNFGFLNECLHDTSSINITKHEIDLPQHHTSFNDSNNTPLFSTRRKRVREEELQEDGKRDCNDIKCSLSLSKLECNAALTSEDQIIEYKQNFGRKMKRRNSKVGQMFFKEDDSFFLSSMKFSNNSEIMSKRRRSSIGILFKNTIDRYGIYCIPEIEEKKDSAPIVSANDIVRTQLEDDLDKLILK